jgi:hypothetical protein
MALPCLGKSVFEFQKVVMKSYNLRALIGVKVRREIEDWKTICATRCTKLLSGFAINAALTVRANASREPKQKVVKISSQPESLNSGKNGRKILFQNETRAPRTHEKMNGKM